MPNPGIPGFDDGHPGEDPNYGWNRASIQYKSRRAIKPNMRPDDLLMPSGFGNFRMLAMCVAMALMITVLYVWAPLFFLNFFVPLSGLLYGTVLAGAALSLTLFLYFVGSRETRRDRELAARL